MSDALLLFLDAHGELEGWLQLRGREIASRGIALEGLPPLIDAETSRPVEVVAVVPGEAVTLHWLELPAGLAPAQAVAAARLMAAEASAQPLDLMHVAVGPEAEGGPLRPVAIVPALAMAGWLRKLQALGLDPDVILPEPLLLRPPAEGFVRHDRGPVPVYRGMTDAFSIEPELAEIITAGAPVAAVDADTFERGMFEAVAHPVVNLRQGAFAKRRRWTIEWKLVRRLALLLLAILFVTFAIQVVSIWRYTYAADALEAEADRIVGSAGAGDQERLAELRGAAGYASLASIVFAAVRATPNAELSGMIYDRGGMRLTVMGDSPATIVSLEQRIEASGYDVAASPMRTGGGRPTAELTVRAR